MSGPMQGLILAIILITLFIISQIIQRRRKQNRKD
ncbi:Uncharacterised protein [Nocardia brasiliensis]|nr:Uncharacterised protein [Nocardia brasiliensis]